MAERPPTIAELVDVARVETVARLDGRPGWLEALVLTGDVAHVLETTLDIASAGRGGAFFLVGHFGSGKSHLLAALAELVSDDNHLPLPGWDPRLRELARAARPALAVAVPLVEHRAGAPLEDIVLARAWPALGRPAPAPGTDRRAAWDPLLAAAGEAGRAGLVVLLDELSEFLRAKQGPALTEDLRFLQFLGEWARGRPVLVVAALQESIDEVANVSQRELARIRDRYRTLGLSMRHVEDLVRGRLVRLRPGAERWVERAHAELDVAFPGWGVSVDRLARCYPLHPATLAVLEGLRFLFSQQRGVVDFICRQLIGDAAAGIPPWQERRYLDLVTPDRVYDHFRGRLHERVETRRLAEAVVPYYERAGVELFDREPDRELALRVVKLLCLLAVSPVERPRTASELAHMLLARLSVVDPAANVGYLERAVLDPLVGRGAYVMARADEGGVRTYTVELEAAAAEIALERIRQTRAELVPGDRGVVRTLLERGSSASLPLKLLADVGMARRELLWQNTLRSLVVGLVRVPELTEADVAGAVDQARAAGAEGCLLVAEPDPDDPDVMARADALAATSPRLGVWMPAPLTSAEVDTMVEHRSRQLVLDAARSEGHTEPGGLVDFLERSLAADEAQARELLHRSYFAGAVVYGPGAYDPDLPSLAGLPFERLLVALAAPLLNRLHPDHREVAPRGELVGERLLRQLVVDVLAQPRLGAGTDWARLRSLVAGYLAPLGLVRRHGEGFTLAPDPGRSRAVAEALRLVPGGDRVRVADVVRQLADGPVGLTEPETLLVLNGCVQAGLVEAWRGRSRHDGPLLAVGPADRLSAGELLEPRARRMLSGLVSIVGPGPFEPWNASVQRARWERARVWLDARREELAQVRVGLDALADSPMLAGVGTDAVSDDLERVAEVVRVVDTALGPVPGLRQLVAAIGDAEAVVGAAGRLAGVARFLREELARVEQGVAYLTHDDFTIPANERRLTALRAEALAMLGGILRLAAEDRVAEFISVEREVRRAYMAAYREAHDDFHAPSRREPVQEVESSAAYRALAALAALDAVAVPDDRIKVDRALAAAAPSPCTRRLDLELAWKPRCACGFALGQEPAPVDRDALAAMVGRGVRQHLAELNRPEHRARLEQAADDLAGLGRDELATDLRSLLGVISPPESADPTALTHLLDGPLAPVVRDVLGGARLVVHRDLAELRENLIGRRYSKRRLLELVAEWVDPSDELPAGGFVEVVDTGDRSVPIGAAPAAVGGATADFLAHRFPRLASVLAPERPADGFWLSAWWAERPAAPAWLPAGLRADGHLLAVAADAARTDLGALAELADLDARVGPESLLGDQVAAALDLGATSNTDVVSVLTNERLLRHPMRLAADELARRLAGEWRLAEQVAEPDLSLLAAAHALVAEAELGPLAHVVAAARHLARLERCLGDVSCRALVEEIYPADGAPVPELLSRAELASVGGGLLSAEAVDAVRAAAGRLLRTADDAFRGHAGAGFPGCLRIWEVGERVLAPLLQVHDRVAVLLVDAMRADLWARVRPLMVEVLQHRSGRQSWAVVPEPTRTTEAVAALYVGRPVPAGSGPDSPADLGVPFAHLGAEATALVGADREGSAEALRQLWADGPRLAVAVATAVDEKIHRSSVELDGLLAEAASGLQRRVLPTLAALPPAVPLVVLADHGFRENPSWGRGPGGRYTHGGLSLEESVIPVAVFGAVAPEVGEGGDHPRRAPSPPLR
ncbi:MAG: DUF6079 family protein [Acidimicrobiales bacterium]